ncbi:MAG: alpha/beta fold hydrolase [Acidimicrobiia bacterium]|nr:alpha/beta fold hydrolase [Acidimicrobiia bacterium]
MPAIVLLHGFTQTSGSWQAIADRLRDRYDVRTPDLPGHGTAGDERFGLWETAAVVAEGNGPATYVGYSMGGRVALHVAIAHPEVVERLVLVSATAGIDHDEERAARRQADEELADRIEAIGVDAFLDEWLAQPLFTGLPADAPGLAERRANTAAGLAASLRTSGTGMMDPPLWDRLAAIESPVLVVAGELDGKFRRLGAQLVRSIGDNAELVVVAGAGHAVPFEAPERFTDALERWFAVTDEESG